MYWITRIPCPHCGLFRMSKDEFETSLHKHLKEIGQKITESSNGFLAELSKGLVKIYLGRSKVYEFYCVKCGFSLHSPHDADKLSYTLFSEMANLTESSILSFKGLEVTCAECGYTWHLRTENLPKKCPSCGSLDWNG